MPAKPVSYSLTLDILNMPFERAPITLTVPQTPFTISYCFLSKHVPFLFNSKPSDDPIQAELEEPCPAKLRLMQQLSEVNPSLLRINYEQKGRDLHDGVFYFEELNELNNCVLFVKEGTDFSQTSVFKS